MNEHLRECYRSHDQPLGRDPFCQCDALRACEERVTERWESLRGLGESYAYKTGSDNGFDAGLNAGLDAAREAVAATFIGWCKDYMNCTDYEHVCGKRREIIAAIDALRKESND